MEMAAETNLVDAADRAVIALNPEEFGFFDDREAQATARARLITGEDVEIKGITDDEGKKFLVGIRTDGTEVFRKPTGTLPVTRDEFERALGSMALGFSLQDQDPRIRDAVSGLAKTPEEALQLQALLSSNSLAIKISPDGTIEVVQGGTGKRIAATAEAARVERDREAVVDARRRGADIANLGTMLVFARERGNDISGIRGALSLSLGGILGQIDPEFQRQFQRAINAGSEVSPEDVAAFQLRAKPIANPGG